MLMSFDVEVEHSMVNLHILLTCKQLQLFLHKRHLLCLAGIHLLLQLDTWTA